MTYYLPVDGVIMQVRIHCSGDRVSDPNDYGEFKESFVSVDHTLGFLFRDVFEKYSWVYLKTGVSERLLRRNDTLRKLEVPEGYPCILVP